MWGRKGMEKLVEKSVPKLAEFLDRDDFLKQLKDTWRPFIKKGCDVDEEVRKARSRIYASGPFKFAFLKIGLTDENLKGIIKALKEEKADV